MTKENEERFQGIIIIASINPRSKCSVCTVHTLNTLTRYRMTFVKVG